MSCYSLDLRKRVVDFVKNNNSIASTSRIFKVSRPTIHDWVKRDKEGLLKTRKNNIRKPKKVDQQELEEYIKNNPEKTLWQIADYFKVYVNSIYHRIQKANITYKKKNFSIKKEMKNLENNISKKS